MYEKAKQYMWFLVPFLCAISTLIMVFLYDQIQEGYGLILLMPTVYAVLFLAFYRLIFQTDYKFTVSIYFLLQALRLVIMPVAIALAGAKVTTYLRIQTDTIREATFLIMLEFLVVTVFVVTMGQRKIHNMRTEMPVLAGAPIAYMMFAALAVAVYFYFKSRGISLVYFIALPAGEGERNGDLTDTFLVLARQIVTLAVAFMFLAIVNRYQKKNALVRRNAYSNRAILAAILMVCIIVGERRSAQIYTAVTCCYILMLAFPEKKKKIIAMVCGVALIILLIMSVYKMFAAFVYDSYSEALSEADWGVSDLASMLQSYFAGPQNIALAMEFGKVSNLDFSQMLFDFVRSTVPISFFVKNQGSVTSVLMNNYVYSGAQNSGHVLAGTGYGYIFGGVLFSFVPMIINMAISFFAEKRMRTARSYEGLRIWMIIMLRFALNITANSPALVSAATNHLFTASFAFGAAIFIKKVVSGNANTRSVVRHNRI